jgi:uncharacterized membrane protein
VLEDSEYFQEPFVYWFISPLIYVQIAVYALAFVLFGYFLEHLRKKNQFSKWFSSLFLVLILVNILYLSFWFSGVSFGMYLIHPAVFVVLSIVALLPSFFELWKQRNISVNMVIFSGGLLFLLPSLYLVARWIAGEQWSYTHGVRFDVFVLIIGCTSLILFLVYVIAGRYQKSENLQIYQQPLNLAMIAGHLIDGLTSYISIYDPLHMGLPLYLEKHPASNLLMELWPPLFPIVKFFLIVGVIYLFDVIYKKELAQYSRLVNLLKIGILILGFSPGMRDLLRVTMGV